MNERDRGTRLAELASLLADPTRAVFCLALLDGRAWTAGELARHAGVSAPTASGHLHRLVAAGLLAEHRQGRHRYVRLADGRAAALVEDLAGHLEPDAAPVGGLRAAAASTALARGRTCYDHLAGRLGVAVADAMAERGHLETSAGFALSDKGREWFAAALGVGTEDWSRSRRPVARECLDWTERRPHLAGLAGAELCGAVFARGWARRIGSGRAVRLTPSGAAAFPEVFGVDPERAGLV
jgi:DNA-binding transcriptional ArsR family regulator